jgi:hypothetical protein
MRSLARVAPPPGRPDRKCHDMMKFGVREPHFFRSADGAPALLGRGP